MRIGEFKIGKVGKTSAISASRRFLGGKGQGEGLREGRAQQWIRDEARWLEMLGARNRMAHVYSAEQALEVFGRLADFSRALGDLAKALEVRERINQRA